MIVFFVFKGHYEKVYDNQLNLAYCFNDPEEKWLSNYFYEQCFNTAKLVKIDGGKREAQAHANMGLISEEQGKSLRSQCYIVSALRQSYLAICTSSQSTVFQCKTDLQP